MAPAVVSAASIIAPAVSTGPADIYQHSFTDLNGTDTPFSAWLGKPVVLNFWATWCPPCVKEMPDLDALHKKHTGVSFIGLAIDTSANVRKFLAKVPVSYPLLVAGHGGIDLMRSLGNSRGGLPFTVVFDAGGVPLGQILGVVHPEELDAFVVNMQL